MVETTNSTGGSNGGTTSQKSMTDKIIDFFKKPIGMGIAAGAIGVLALYWFVF